MPNPMKLETNRSTVSSSSAYSHETANIVSVINGNVLNLFFTLKEIEKSFNEEYTRLEKESEGNECYGNIADKFYDGYVRMESAFKKLLAETTQVNIGKSF